MFQKLQSSHVTLYNIHFHSLSLGSLNCLYIVWYSICVLYVIYTCIIILRTTNRSQVPEPRDKNKKKSKMNETPDVTLATQQPTHWDEIECKLLAISSEVYVCSGFSFNNTYLHLSLYVLCICFVVCTFLSPLTPSFFPHSCYQTHK